MDTETTETIRLLEESLWRMETRLDPALMRQTFAEDMVEFSQSGRIFALDDLLQNEADDAFTATLPLLNFVVNCLSSTLVQTTYVSELFSGGKVARANRSSIWLKANDTWRLRFHQGTPVRR